MSILLGLHVNIILKTAECGLTLNAPFTQDEDYWETAHDSENHHLSLVVAPSPLAVATVQRTLS